MPPDANGNPQGTQFSGIVIAGTTADDYPCSDNGNDCDDIYAASILSVKPSNTITWFQAQQACANVGKRLLRNGEWQMAAAGTPDPGTDNGVSDCNTGSNFGEDDDPANTGSRAQCVSRWGAFDMVGNLDEWVEDWIQGSGSDDTFTKAPSDFGNDLIFAIDEAPFPLDDNAFPPALIRGGTSASTRNAGVFALDASNGPTTEFSSLGFRCGR